MSRRWGGELSPTITLAVVTHGQMHRLQRFLQTYRNAASTLEKPPRLLVIDDGSPDGTPKLLARASADLPLTWRRISHGGIARARNTALRDCPTPWIAFTDTDCIIDAEYLSALSHLPERHAGCDAVEGRVEPEVPEPAPFHHGLANTHGGMYATANLILRVEAALAAGGFDEAFGCFREDVDLGLRINAITPIPFDPHITVRHPWIKKDLLRVLPGQWKRTRDLIASEQRLYAKHPRSYRLVRHRNSAEATLRDWRWKPVFSAVRSAWRLRPGSAQRESVTWAPWAGLVAASMLEALWSQGCTWWQTKVGAKVPAGVMAGTRTASKVSGPPSLRLPSGESNRLRVLVLWHGATVESYRPILRELARHVDLAVLTPEAWTHGSAVHRLEESPDEPFALIRGRFLFPGTAHYLAPGLFSLARAFRPQALLLMDEWDRLNTLTHQFLVHAGCPGRRIPTFFYALQNLQSPAYYRPWHQAAMAANRRLASGIAAASEEAAVCLRRRGWRGNLALAPLGSCPEMFHPADAERRLNLRREFGVPNGSTVLAFAGSLCTAKGVGMLGQAFRELNARRVRTPYLLVAGAGPLAAWLEEIAGPHCTMLGPLPPARLVQVLQAADYAILPSLETPAWKEQVGRTLVEAVLCGCIALGSDSGNIPDIVADPRGLFPSGNQEALTRLLEALPLPCEGELRAVQSERIRSRYTASEMARRLAALLAEARA